jgi:uncharacterized damage-inducible protein DinB
MIHNAQANAAMVTIATGDQNVGDQVSFSPIFENSPAAINKDSVAHYVAASYDLAINAVKQMDFNKLGEVVSFAMPGGKRTDTRLAWLFKAFEHQTHHRGQCTVYLRLAGIRPPAEKLW